LLISSFTAYYSLILTREHVSVVLDTSPRVERTAESILVFPYETELIFINSGNRPAAILSLSVIFIQQRNTDDNCMWDSGDTASFKTNFEPLVIKQGEIIRHRLTIVGPLFPKANVVANGTGSGNPFSVTFKGAPGPAMPIPVQMCLQIRIATPSTAYFVANVPI